MAHSLPSRSSKELSETKLIFYCEPMIFGGVKKLLVLFCLRISSSPGHLTLHCEMQQKQNVRTMLLFILPDYFIHPFIHPLFHSSIHFFDLYYVMYVGCFPTQGTWRAIPTNLQLDNRDLSSRAFITEKTSSPIAKVGKNHPFIINGCFRFP